MSLFERERNFTEGQLEVVEALVLLEQTNIFYMFSSDKFYKTVWHYMYPVYNILKIVSLGFLEF
jgi:hypothetical protein